MGFLLSLLLKPFYALAFLWMPYAIAWHLWRRMPDSRLKRILFTSWGDDRGPWVKAKPAVVVPLLRHRSDPLDLQNGE